MIFFTGIIGGFVFEIIVRYIFGIICRFFGLIESGENRVRCFVFSLLVKKEEEKKKRKGGREKDTCLEKKRIHSLFLFLFLFLFCFFLFFNKERGRR